MAVVQGQTASHLLPGGAVELPFGCQNKVWKHTLQLDQFVGLLFLEGFVAALVLPFLEAAMSKRENSVAPTEHTVFSNEGVQSQVQHTASTNAVHSKYKCSTQQVQVQHTASTSAAHSKYRCSTQQVHALITANTVTTKTRHISLPAPTADYQH